MTAGQLPRSCTWSVCKEQEASVLEPGKKKGAEKAETFSGRRRAEKPRQECLV